MNVGPTKSPVAQKGIAHLLSRLWLHLLPRGTEATKWYLAIGLGNTLLYVALGTAFGWAGLAPAAAGIAAFLPCFALGYLGHKMKTFASKGRHVRELPRFLILGVLGVLLSALVPHVTSLAGLPMVLAMAVASVAIPVMNLLVMRFWVFRDGIGSEDLKS